MSTAPMKEVSRYDLMAELLQLTYNDDQALRETNEQLTKENSAWRSNYLRLESTHNRVCEENARLATAHHLICEENAELRVAESAVRGKHMVVRDEYVKLADTHHLVCQRLEEVLMEFSRLEEAYRVLAGSTK